MRSLSWIVLVVLLALPAALPAAPASDAEIQKLIDQLGSDEPATRQAAARRLEEIGEPALPALRRASRSAADVDTRLRAGVIARAIDNRMWGEVRSFGGPRAGYWLNRVAFTRDGRQAIATGGAVIWYDLASGKEVRRVLELQFARGGLALSRDGKHFLTGHQNDRVVRMVETATGKEVQTFTGHTAGVGAVALSPDGTRAVSGCDDRTIRLWDVKTGKELRRFQGVDTPVHSLAFSPDGRRVLSGHSGGKGDRLLRLWDSGSGKEVRALPAGHENVVTAVAFLAGGRTALSASMDGTLRLWDVEAGKELRKMRHDGGARDAAVSPDGRRALSAGFGDRTVRVWDLESGSELHRFEGHRGAVLGVAFSPDGRQALSSDSEYTVRLWRLAK